MYTSSVGSLARAGSGVADEGSIPAEAPTDSVYRAVKWSMEREVERWVARGLPAVTLLPGGCVGPSDARAGTGGILVGVVRGALPWWVDGTVNLVDVADVARAHALALGAPPGARYCVSGHDVSVRWLLWHIRERFGGEVPARELTASEARERADEEERAAASERRRAAFPRELVDLITGGQRVSSARAERELGLRTSPLDPALERAHEWYLRMGYLKTNPRKQSEAQ